jgi:hypothetical protein
VSTVLDDGVVPGLQRPPTGLLDGTVIQLVALIAGPRRTSACQRGVPRTADGGRDACVPPSKAGEVPATSRFCLGTWSA